MSDVSNLKDTIIPKSDQLNADQLLAGPMTITVSDVRRGSDDQPVIVHYQGENGRPFKPCKSMRKVLIFAWGENGAEWIGKRMTLFNNPDVKFGGVKVGGIRISHMSDIKGELALSLTATKGKKEPFIIKPLAASKPAPQVDWMAKLESAAKLGMAALVAEWKNIPAPDRAAIGQTCPQRLKDIAQLADAPPEPEPEPPAPEQNDDDMF